MFLSNVINDDDKSFSRIIVIKDFAGESSPKQATILANQFQLHTLNEISFNLLVNVYTFLVTSRLVQVPNAGMLSYEFTSSITKNSLQLLVAALNDKFIANEYNARGRCIKNGEFFLMRFS